MKNDSLSVGVSSSGCVSFGYKSNSSAFTLIELLITLAAIAVLAVLLMPVVSSIQKHANVVRCTANLQQLSVGSGLYLQEHNMTFWPHLYNNDVNGNPNYLQGWWNQSRWDPVPHGPLFYLGYDSAAGDLEKRGTVVDCPNMKKGINGLIVDYMYNGSIGEFPAAPLKLLAVKNQSRKILLMTGYDTRFLWPARNPLTAYAPLWAANNPEVKTYAAFPHPGGRANVLFVDGHSELMTEQEMTEQGLEMLCNPIY